MRRRSPTLCRIRRRSPTLCRIRRRSPTPCETGSRIGRARVVSLAGTCHTELAPLLRIPRSSHPQEILRLSYQQRRTFLFAPTQAVTRWPIGRKVTSWLRRSLSPDERRSLFRASTRPTARSHHTHSPTRGEK